MAPCKALSIASEGDVVRHIATGLEVKFPGDNSLAAAVRFGEEYVAITRYEGRLIVSEVGQRWGDTSEWQIVQTVKRDA